MGIGVGIVLLVIGLILVTGAIELPHVIDDAIASDILGWILIVVAVLALVLALVSQRRSRTVVQERRYEDPPPPRA